MFECPYYNVKVMIPLFTLKSRKWLDSLSGVLTLPCVEWGFSLFPGSCLNDPFSEVLDLFPQLRNRKRDFIEFSHKFVTDRNYSVIVKLFFSLNF